MGNLKVVKTYNSRIDAEIGKGVLDANGIKAVISVDDAGGSYPFPLQPSIGVRLLVEEKDLKKALVILDKIK